MKAHLKTAWQSFLRYFSQGLLYLIPLGVTIMVFIWVFNLVDSFAKMGVGAIETTGIEVKHYYWILLLALMVFITLVGVIGPFIFSTPLSRYVKNLINKTPVIKMIYNSVQDLLSVFVGNKKKFTQPVIFKVSDSSDIEMIGFLTQQNLTDLSIEDNKVSVYVPFSFSIMGSLYVVPAKNVRLLNSPPQDILKFVISGGISKTEDQEEK